MLHDVRRHALEFDILHFHVDLIHFPFFESLAHRTVTTLHGRLDLKDLPEAYRCWQQYPLISVSDRQRLALPEANGQPRSTTVSPSSCIASARGRRAATSR